MPDADVLVIGGGLAGCTAALAAARSDPGATVRLVTAGESTLRKATGLIDVLGYRPDGSGPVVDPFDAIEDLPDGHPYSRVGTDAVRAGLALFDDVTGAQYAGEHTDRNALVPTHQGRVKPTARYPASVAPGLASDEGEVLLLGFESLTDFDARLIGKRLQAGNVPFQHDAIDVEFPGSIDGQPPQLRMARALDQNEPVDGVPVREALAETVEEYRFFEDRVGFPAVLGQTDPDGVRADLADALGAPVFEVPMGPPSVPGYRLDALLMGALDRAGVSVHVDSPVVGADTADGAVETVLVDDGATTASFEASAFVVATGGLVSGGIRAERSGVREPVFDCPVSAPPDRREWAETEPLGDHRFACFGVDIDRATRPLDGDGSPAYANLYAAGSVVRGHDLAAEKSGSGVSLATGLRAGRRAVE